jgi:hypothetical protein
MSKMASHDPFGYLKHKLWPKEGPKVKLAIWLRPWKVENRLDSLACRWHVTYCWTALDKGYNFDVDLTSIKGLDTKSWDSKITGVLILGILGFQLGSPGTKWHLGVGCAAKHKVYYKGEGGGVPEVRVVVSLMSPCLHVVRPCTKSAPIMH